VYKRQAYKNIDSKILLKRTLEIIKGKGYSVSNIDCTICLEKPRIAPFVPQMKNVIAGILGLSPDDISVKATTTEKMGFTGREEGAVALAVACLV
jgi:2-C-methyl-D-erythritol 2,4-cyclodiphosphate synthase